MDGSSGVPVGRRVVLGMVGLGVLGVGLGSRVQDGVNQTLAPIGDFVPAGGGFRYYSVVSSVKRFDETTYRLGVKGKGVKSLSLTMAELAAMPQTGITKDFQCVTGWRVKDVAWSGVALPDLLEAVGADTGAKGIMFTSFDGAYTESLTMEQALRKDVLVATSMENGPVKHNHGGPVRLYVAPMYGYKSLKWLGGIEVTDELQDGYWEVRGYDTDAWVGRSNGRDDAPTV